jgi:hypothetical protein
MFAKLFSRITESSLMEEEIVVRYTFVMMLAICDPNGYVIGTDVAIARRLNMPLDVFQKSLEVLLSPDKDSNSKEEEGRRILVSDGERGYKLINYLTYRDMKDEEGRREYMRRYMKNYRNGEPVNTSKQVLTHPEEEEEPTEEEKADELFGEGGGLVQETNDNGFETFWAVYPKKAGKVPAKKSFAKAIKKRPLAEMLADLDRFKRSDQWRRDGGQYIPHAATWLNQERWNDELTTNRRNVPESVRAVQEGRCGGGPKSVPTCRIGDA